MRSRRHIDLHFTPSGLEWVVNGYARAFGGLLAATEERPGRLDLPGAISVTGGMTLLVYGLSREEER